MSEKKRLSRHDDRPGSALSLWHLWNLVGATEELDGDDEAFTEEMWTYYSHKIADESEHPESAPDLRSPLGPIEPNEGVGPAAS